MKFFVVGGTLLLLLCVLAIARAANSSSPSATVARDGKALATEPQDVQDQFTATWGNQAATEWAKEHNAASTPTPVATKPWDYAVKTTTSGTPIVLLSEDEVRDFTTHVTSVNQVANLQLPLYHGVAKLSGGTHLRQTTGKTYTAQLATGASSVPMYFYSVRVVDGPAAGMEGWIPATGITN